MKSRLRSPSFTRRFSSIKGAIAIAVPTPLYLSYQIHLNVHCRDVPVERLSLQDFGSQVVGLINRI
ncbi:MAG: hypothetical protein LDL41_03955 [Coleofasciculus sp. S288]|nr:hypothetical protein [Coleofasciculus sp. S288]